MRLFYLLLYLLSSAFADEINTEYTKISDYENVPIHVSEYFQDLGCQVPQIPKDKLNISGRDNSPFSVNLSPPNQKEPDWGVLCSRDGISSIVIYWHDEAKCPNEFAAKRDDHSWEGIGDDTWVYARYVTGKSGIVIEEPFLNKGIRLEYSCKEGKWVKRSLGGH